MSNALHQPVNLGSFLAWEERQELKYEFDGLRPVAMTGGTLAHDLITEELQAALRRRLRGSPCRAFGSNAKVLVAGRSRYPDATVSCAPQDFSASTIADPIIVFEVVSPGRAHVDRIEKVRDYRATASIQRYVILEQSTVGATVFARRGDLWVADTLDLAGIVALPEVGIEFPLAECYAGLELPSPEADHA